MKVVVYRCLSPDKVKDAYPVVRGISDYRYVEYERALRFLDTRIKELEDFKREEAQEDSVKTWGELIATLKSTGGAITMSLN